MKYEVVFRVSSYDGSRIELSDEDLDTLYDAGFDAALIHDTEFGDVWVFFEEECGGHPDILTIRLGRMVRQAFPDRLINFEWSKPA